MKILAFEFSSPQRSVAVLNPAVDGTPLICDAAETSPRQTMKPLTMVAAVLDQAGLERDQVECLVIGLGPGSYTGIRAGIALAQGWQLGRPIKTLGISSAECVAHQAQAEGITGSISVVIDAQRGEFYLAGYELTAAGIREASPLRLASHAETAGDGAAGRLLVGPEVTKWFPEGRIIFPQAAMLARMARARTDFIPAEKVEPIYLRETTFVKAPPGRVGLGL